MQIWLSHPLNQSLVHKLDLKYCTDMSPLVMSPACFIISILNDAKLQSLKLLTDFYRWICNEQILVHWCLHKSYLNDSLLFCVFKSSGMRAVLKRKPVLPSNKWQRQHPNIVVMTRLILLNFPIVRRCEACIYVAANLECQLV